MARGTGIFEHMEGRLEGITIYKKNGKTIIRCAHNSRKPRSMSRKQFAQRQRMTHNNALWKVLSQTDRVFFEGGSSPCHRFRSINTESPIVYLTKQMRQNFTVLLLPKMVISDGPLTPIGYQLGEVDGQPALLTDLTIKDVKYDEILLYILEQRIYPQQSVEELIQLDIHVERITPDQFVNVPSSLLTPYKDKKGCLALVGNRFANSMLGFSLVRIKDGHASHQHVVTNCTYYERFTTEEALQVAAKSYGGLKG